MKLPAIFLNGACKDVVLEVIGDFHPVVRFPATSARARRLLILVADGD